MEVDKTANGKYRYDTIYHGRSLDQWVQGCHKYNCEINNWKYQPLRKGAFGYDNLTVSLVHLFEKLNNMGVEVNTLETLASEVHNGWCENYIYWRDNEIKAPYRPPATKLGDERRNLCSVTSYIDLHDDEKGKDRIIVKYILGQLS